MRHLLAACVLTIPSPPAWKVSFAGPGADIAEVVACRHLKEFELECVDIAAVIEARDALLEAAAAEAAAAEQRFQRWHTPLFEI